MDKTLVGMAVLAVVAGSAKARPIEGRDLFALRAVKQVALSPDGRRVAYAVESHPTEGRNTRQLWIATTAGGAPAPRRVGGELDRGSQPVFSPDGRALAFNGKIGDREGLFVVAAEGGTPRWLAAVQDTNSPLTNEGAAIAWSPDGRRIAFVSATPGPETEVASGDPVVITRYKYKPDDAEGHTRFSDNRRRHVFVVDLQGGAPQALTGTRGVYDEHSIDWSPDGREIVFVSNREPDPDLFYNPDLFAVKVADGTVRRLTATESAEFNPRFSPDGQWIAFEGTRRGLTDLETEMEDRHVWVMRADGSERRELGAAIDNRQGPPRWAGDSRAVYTTVQERGRVRVARLPLVGAPEVVVGDDGRVESFDVARDGSLAWSFSGRRDLAQLQFRPAGGAAARALTDLNRDALAGVDLAEVESFTFTSNDFRFEVEAFLTAPAGRTAGSRHPLVVMIHGGPHGQQGPAFNFKAQAYAARGYAVLMVNYRGSTGYGQRFADAVFRDQNGDEAHDVLQGTLAALRRNPWLDRERLGVEGGSYGGQLSCWLVTQTHIFKAAIPLAPIVNNISYNYTTYYNMYEQMEWGALPHQGKLMETLWERSALRYVAQVRTPVMLVHGENDNDVPIMESEQFYVGLRDVGVEAVMVRYPREGHGLREPKHQVDLIARSLAWYQRHFSKASAP